MAATLGKARRSAKQICGGNTRIANGVAACY
jgi:hypothetical protein